jgi:hypothetical protein
MATCHEIGQERLTPTDRVVGDEGARRKVIQDRMATGTDDELVAECGTTESAGGTDLSERNNHVQLANDFTQFVQGSNVAPRLGQEILDDPATSSNNIII